ncbi:preprotein translocase subunit Sec61beta [Candidatus Pacearchaeota archaeon]|nr:preprotein translocase subunit Sec61beta [Candidatus Pacearchaeota archaeon]
MADNRIQMPGGFGGLMRFSDEYKSKFNLKPVHVIGFVILVLAFRIFLDLIY